MPMFIREPRTSGMGVSSPLRSNLEDMISTCEILDKELAVIAEDGEEFGGLSEETFSYNAPQVLKLLQRLSQVGYHCTRDINLDDESFDVDERSLSRVVYNFLSQHRRTLDLLTAQQKTLRYTGAFVSGVAQQLQRQQLMLNAFRTALDSRYGGVKVRTAPDWIDLGETMRSALIAYPLSEE
ncbi:hypothetical protein E2P81_ATG01899 [Venturia nashicola]|uniref:Uncharacterized protein n=1 Tax=Venturia nashicola TaxID=86259 RepID=A0A4Z1P274_9PEZI|nr:hypothetical protein E6O75_ATG01941 [Venturia nashicola]TLD35596.1 hypothetical protein E2P81_ATG01899 [Venturia nashicola]